MANVSEPPGTCFAGHPTRTLFRFPVRGESSVSKCFRHALVHPRLVQTGLLTALVVGTILTAINQGNLIVQGDWRNDMVWKIPMTYAVPYCVVTWSALRTAYVRQ